MKKVKSRKNGKGEKNNNESAPSKKKRKNMDGRSLQKTKKKK